MQPEVGVAVNVRHAELGAGQALVKDDLQLLQSERAAVGVGMNGGAGGQSGPGSGLQALDLAGGGIAVLRAGLDPAGLDVGAVHALGDLLDIAGGDLVHVLILPDDG